MSASLAHRRLANCVALGGCLCVRAYASVRFWVVHVRMHTHGAWPSSEVRVRQRREPGVLQRADICRRCFVSAAGAHPLTGRAPGTWHLTPTPPYMRYTYTAPNGWWWADCVMRRLQPPAQHDGA